MRLEQNGRNTVAISNDQLFPSKTNKFLRFIAELLSKFDQLRRINECSERNHKQLLNWFENERPLGEGKDEFLLFINDFVTPGQPSGKENWVEDIVESWLDTKPWSWCRVRSLLLPTTKYILGLELKYRY
jgi:hypothetical protein